ncbi:MAG: hypothetical protein WCK86_07360 [Planctomycetia bacterium]
MIHKTLLGLPAVAVVFAASLWLIVGQPLNAADTAPPTIVAQPVIDLTGTWDGQWSSRSTAHKGPMTATFCRLDNGQYSVTFTGKFCALIPFRYKAVLVAKQHPDGSVSLHGSKNLGPLFGTFRFKGTVTGNQFHANYSSKSDTGAFRMTRSCGR